MENKRKRYFNIHPLSRPQWGLCICTYMTLLTHSLTTLNDAITSASIVACNTITQKVKSIQEFLKTAVDWNIHLYAIVSGRLGRHKMRCLLITSVNILRFFKNEFKYTYAFLISHFNYYCITSKPCEQQNER